MRTVRLCLVGVALTLVLIGLVSGTPVRYMIQALPIALALRLLARSPGSLGAYAAVALFLHWMLAMVLIWLFLLGLSDFARGQYPPIEVVLTILVAFFCLVGILLLIVLCALFLFAVVDRWTEPLWMAFATAAIANNVLGCLASFASLGPSFA